MTSSYFYKYIIIQKFNSLSTLYQDKWQAPTFVVGAEAVAETDIVEGKRHLQVLGPWRETMPSKHVLTKPIVKGSFFIKLGILSLYPEPIIDTCYMYVRN